MDCQATLSISVTQCDPTSATTPLHWPAPATVHVSCPAKQLRLSRGETWPSRCLPGRKRSPSWPASTRSAGSSSTNRCTPPTALDSAFAPVLRSEGEIRCQFIILARKDEPTPDFPCPKANRHHSVPEKTNRHRISPEKTNRHRISPKRRTDTGFPRTTFDLTVYASQDGSPHHHARLASGCWSSFARRDSYPQGFSERFQSSGLFLPSKAYLTQGHHT